MVSCLTFFRGLGVVGSSSTLSASCSDLLSPFVLYISWPYTCVEVVDPALEMMEVRGVRGGCCESGFIWKDEPEGSKDGENTASSCTEDDDAPKEPE